MAPVSKPMVLVVVHGVGAVEPGTMVRELCGELAGPFERDLNVKDLPPKLIPTDGRRYQTAYELYWADLKPGGNTKRARWGRPVQVMLALSQIGAVGWDDGESGINGYSQAGNLLHRFMWGLALSLSAIYFPLLHMTVLPQPVSIGVALVSILPTWLLAFSLRNLDTSVCFSAYLTPMLGAVSIFAGYKGWVSTDRSAEIAAWLLSLIYLAVIVLALSAAVGVTIRGVLASNRLSFRCYLVRFAALSLPFSLLGGGLGALSWAFNLWLSTYFGPGSLSQWNTAYTKALPFDLALLEFAFAAATFSFGAVFAIAGAIYFVCIKFGPSESQSGKLGEFLRGSIVPALLVLVVGNTIVSALYVVNVFLFPRDEILQFGLLRDAHDLLLRFGEAIVRKIEGDDSSQSGTAITAFSIYAASSTRIVSFIPSLFGKLRQPAAIIADVVLWLAPEKTLSYRNSARRYLPEEETLSYRRSARRRLADLLKAIGPNVSIHLLAHSQGTVIAVDTLRNYDAQNIDLITAGSPLDSLYKTFLGIELPRPPSVRIWKNFYRTSDYVGGNVSAAGTKKNKSANNIIVDQDYRLNHLDYFRARAIVDQIFPREAQDKSSPSVVPGE
ncbi:hypothetical protein IC232_03650 [Microvirga sp. BT688]|uniref:hypothetical protein n=1 Tax=Microvirga sp. TaxID=1873136 RepID=UPI0016855245|nr:hypothetical protein [Microvirga sp.]MBD2745785.1 hypothetical protein [Microvirga sp.]